MPNYGKASRAGTPNSLPQSGQYPRTPDKVSVGPFVNAPKKAKTNTNDITDPEAEKVEAQLTQAHKQRTAGNRDPLVQSQSYEQYEHELKAKGVVPTNAGYIFKGKKYAEKFSEQYRSGIQRPRLT